MSEMKFNKDALRALTENPGGRVSRHIREKADELTDFAQDEAHVITNRRVPRERINNMVDNTEIAPATIVLGIHNQIDSRASNRAKSLTKYLAEKALREDREGWMKKAIKKQRYFRPA